MADLGGISNVGGFDGFGDGEGIGDTPHLTVHKEILLGTSVNRKVETWSGPYDNLLEKAKAYELGKYVEDDDLPAGTSDTNAASVGYGYAFVSEVRLTRDNGNVGRMVVTISQNRARVFVSVDHVEVQRPIETWRADEGDNAPDLAKIRVWKALKGVNDEDYESFKGLTEGSPTRMLAELIYKGIQTYSVYAPVVTVTMTTFSFPQLNLEPVGEIHDSPVSPYGWDEVHGKSIRDIIQNFTKPNSRPHTSDGYKWLLASSKCTPNADGTYQWVMQYQACDAVEEVLFG